MTNASEKAGVCAGGRLSPTLPQVKKQTAQGRNDHRHPTSFILLDPFISIGHLC